MMTWRWVIMVVVGLIFTGNPQRASAEDGMKGPGWVGKETLIYVEIPQPNMLVDQIKADHVQNYLYSIPSYQRLIKANEYQQFRQMVSVVSGLLNTTWDDGFRKLAGGGAVLAVDANDGKPGIVLVVTPTDIKFLHEAVELIIKLSREDATKNGRPDPIKQLEYRGTDCYGVGDTAFGIHRDCLIIANRGDALKALIDRVEDKTNAVLTNKPYDEARKSEAVRDQGTSAWGYIDLAGLRKVDTTRFTIPDKLDPGQILLFGSWIETLKQASWMAGSIGWKDLNLGAKVWLPIPQAGLPEPLKTYIPGKGLGAPANLNPPGTIASLSLWRDLSQLWDVRKSLFPAEFVQGLGGLDTLAGQFFGAKDFGEGVLAALTSDWRLVVAHQDYAAMKPSPDVKLPGFAIVVGLKEEDDEFVQRLKAAFQTFVGLSNLGAAQNQYPPLEIGSETVEGVTIATTKFMPSKVPAQPGTPVHLRHNFSPAAGQVGNQFVISTSTGLARDLVKVLKAPSPPSTETLVLEADGRALASLVKLNRTRLVMQNMIEKGNAKPTSEEEIDTIAKLLDYAGSGRLTIKDGDKALEFQLQLILNPVK